MAEKVTVTVLAKMKAEGTKITMLTAYDYPFARLVDESGVDMILVGDSLGMVVQGESSSLPVTMDQMIYHTTLVARATKRAMVVGDMPLYELPDLCGGGRQKRGPLYQRGRRPPL